MSEDSNDGNSQAGDGRIVERGFAAQILENARVNARSRVLAEASQAFSVVGTDYPSTLQAIARVVADLVGDGCIVTLLADDGETLTNAASAHRDTDLDAALPDLSRAGAGLQDDQHVRFGDGRSDWSAEVHERDQPGGYGGSGRRRPEAHRVVIERPQRRGRADPREKGDPRYALTPSQRARKTVLDLTTWRFLPEDLACRAGTCDRKTLGLIRRP